ncbi:AI-2E family transporter [Flavisolibacter ginsengisoli]|jgi:predicted PurR-regulated permease PerM|uniref:Predicted PurR-regulated permease PerM n=1 Tax=Flavisolibacter ginsengisoli DSM 18119 TaxID=1121884 RepID=A0A1M5BSU0_9BACT|nr:AI-2E family transporter [Flavisolibacter ginsengisoli]SHF45421.1 Predicted PurR-regulated permease PerM [Flavisolibacter ginsengisoli DSM 18119]
MNNNTAESRYKNGVRLILIAAFVILGLWFAKEVISILFLFFLAVVLTLILNAPTMWLVSKKVSRTGAALLVFFAMMLFLFFLGWLVVPRILEQVSSLVAGLPKYVTDLQRQVASLLVDYPSLREKVLDNSALNENLPSVSKVITSVGSFSYSLIGGIFLLIVFFSIVVYMLINPAPLIETYLTLFAKEKRQKATLALAKASQMMVGWMWSNLVVGLFEAILVFIFLTFMGLPGVWVWAGLALFAELVPKLGLYIMAVPPVLIALSIAPMTALWVLIFYLATNEIMGDFVMPRIRSSTMNLHPVSTLFVMLAMASAFGLIGALIATPLTAFIKAYYETFYLSTASKEKLGDQVRMILNREV